MYKINAVKLTLDTVCMYTCVNQILFLYSETETPSCPSDHFQCPSSGLCIRRQETCDGTNHCGDFADELLDSCPGKWESCAFDSFWGRKYLGRF